MPGPSLGVLKVDDPITWVYWGLQKVVGKRKHKFIWMQKTKKRLKFGIGVVVHGIKPPPASLSVPYWSSCSSPGYSSFNPPPWETAEDGPRSRVPAILVQDQYKVPGFRL